MEEQRPLMMKEDNLKLSAAETEGRRTMHTSC